MWLAQWTVAAVVILGASVLALKSRAWSFLSEPKGKEKPETASPKKRQAIYNQLRVESPDLVEFDTPQLLLDMAVSLHDRKEAALGILDDKAQKLAALIAGSTSLFVLLGGLDSKVRLQLTPLLVLAALCFFGSLVLCLLALVPVPLEIYLRYRSTTPGLFYEIRHSAQKSLVDLLRHGKKSPLILLQLSSRRRAASSAQAS